MNKKKIFPLICLILLIGAIVMTTYFKKLEKEISAENAKIEMEDNNHGAIESDES